VSGTPLRLGAYAMGLAAVFAAALGVGGLVRPVAAEARPAESHTTAADGHGTEATHGAPGEGAAAALPGLAVSDRGYTLVPAATTLPRGSAVPFAFTVTGPDGARVVDYTPAHEKELHLIVVRRDLAGFQHVHPVRDSAGVWRVSLDLGRAGTYRVFADFVPAAREGSVTLGADLAVPGPYVPAPLPAPAPTGRVGGYEVALHGTPRAGHESELEFTVQRGGRPVTDLQPYLGASGHLVSLRTGDLAYLHTHAVDHDGLRFATTFPTMGTYRLFLDFRHGGTVRTAEFTVSVGGAS
jgi:hypothetical protein